MNQLKAYRLELVITFVGIIISVLILMINLEDFNIEDKRTYKILFSLLTFTISLLFTLSSLMIRHFNKIPQLKNLIETTDDLNSIKENVSQGLVQVTRLNKNHESLYNQLNDLQQEDERVHDLISHLSNKSPMIRDVGLDVISTYLRKIERYNDGFKINGNVWAKEGYIMFWEKMIAEQMEFGFDDDRRMIARVTHSNDIGIWSNSTRVSRRMMQLQKRFIDRGGIILRCLIGKGEHPSEEYLSTMQEMEGIGIEVRYFDINQVEETPYDFLYLHDERMILKWFSYQNGKSLGGFSVSQAPESEVVNRWIELYDLAEQQGRPFTKIPPGRDL